MTVKINDLTIELEPGMAIEVSPDGKSIKISAPVQTLPTPVIIWPQQPYYPQQPVYEPYRITYEPSWRFDSLTACHVEHKAS